MNKRTGKSERLRVFVAAQTAATSHAWAESVRGQSDMIVCGVAPPDDRLAAALHACDRPGVLVVEASGADAIERVEHVCEQAPHVGILAVCNASTSDGAARFFRAGVRGYVLASEPAEKLMMAIRAVGAGGAYLSDVGFNGSPRGTIGLAGGPSDSPLARLSDREMSVFRMLGDGLSVREIAERLYLSPKTVESHREHIKQKLQLRNSREVLRMAIRESILAG